MIAIRSNYSFKEISIVNAYTRISSISVQKKRNEDGEAFFFSTYTIEVLTPNKKHVVDTITRSFEFDPAAVNKIYSFGYTKIKTLPEFSGASDEE